MHNSVWAYTKSLGYEIKFWYILASFWATNKNMKIGTIVSAL